MNLFKKMQEVQKKKETISLLKMVRPMFVTTKNLRIIQRNIVTRRKIIRSNKDTLELVDSNMQFDSANTTNIIWFSWLQGLKDAPELVRMCLTKMHQVYPEKKIMVVTASNFNNFVNIPDLILKKWEKGNISNTHFSDILRTELLIKFGGTWIDSTVLCNERACESIYFKTPLFFYSAIQRNDDAIAGSSWFITSGKSNPVLLLTRELLYNYWAHHMTIDNYFIFHICFKISLESYSCISKNVPTISNVPPHVFEGVLNDRYDADVCNLLLKQSYFHKLSNKKPLRNDSEITTFAHLKKQIGQENEYN